MGFDNYAEKWDTKIRIDRAKSISNEIENTLSRNQYKTAMEFGCGTGLISFNILDRFDRVTLVDSSKGMIDVVKRKIKEYDIDKVEPLHIDLSKSEDLNKKFDVIYSSLVLHHIYDIDDILTHFYELLNKDGEICIVDVDKEDGSFHRKYPDFDGHNGFDHKELENKLVEIGYKEIDIQTFYYGEKIIEGEKIEYSLFRVRANK